VRWDDERYVRLYTRDTIAWKKLPWQSRALMPLLLRVVDRAGIVDLDGYGADGLAELVMMPTEIVAPGLVGLIADGSVEQRGDVLCVRNFLEAQEVPMTDAQRQREKRARDRAKAREAIATESNEPDVTNVTPVRDSHETSLSCHSVPSVPSVTPSEGDASARPAVQVDFGLTVQAAPDPKALQRRMAEAVTHYQRRWIACFKPRDGLPPKLTEGDRGQLGAMLKAHGLDGWKGYLETYLADPDPKLARDGYALALMPRRLNGYRTTVVPVSSLREPPQRKYDDFGDLADRIGEP
jgi:hypothetical protein